MVNQKLPKLPSEVFIYLSISSSKQMIQRAGNSNNNQHPRNHAGEDDEQSSPILESGRDLLAWRKVNVAAQALDEVASRRDPFQRPGQMRFEFI